MFLTTVDEAKHFHMKMGYKFCHCPFLYVVLKRRPNNPEEASVLYDTSRHSADKINVWNDLFVCVKGHQ